MVMNAMHTILVVEDNPAIRQLVCRVLHEAAYETRSAGELEGARLHLRFGPRVDAVVSDCGLPDGTGLDLLGWLRKQNRGDLPVVLMSEAWPLPRAAVSRFEFEFLPKPFLSVHLLAALDRACQRARRPTVPSVASATPAGRLPDWPASSANRPVLRAQDSELEGAHLSVAGAGLGRMKPCLSFEPNIL